MRDEQNVMLDGDHNIVVQAIGDGAHIDDQSPHLTLIPPRNRAPAIRNEVALLNPYSRAIPVVGRESDLESLWDWLHSSRPIAIRTLTAAPARARLAAAIELIESLNDRHPGQWWAGFLTGRELRRFAAQQNLADWGWARPTLIVVDYAASLTTPLRDWLRDLASSPARANGHPLRLLLLEREAAVDQGWLQSLCLGGNSDARVPELFDPLEPKRPRSLASAPQRRAVLAGILAAAAPSGRRQTRRLVRPDQNPRFDRQLENPVWEDPLYLMMAALLSLRSPVVEVL